MDTTRIQYKIEDGVGTLLLVAPEGKPPTLDAAVMDELEQCISSCENLQGLLLHSIYHESNGWGNISKCSKNIACWMLEK